MYQEQRYQEHWRRLRNMDMCRLKINYPEDSAINLEGRLEERFGLKEAVIASSLNENDLKEEIAFFASDYLLRTLKTI